MKWGQGVEKGEDGLLYKVTYEEDERISYSEVPEE